MQQQRQAQATGDVKGDVRDGPHDRLPEDLEEARLLQDRAGEDVDVIRESGEHRFALALDRQARRRDEPRVAEAVETHVREADVQLPDERIDDEHHEPQGGRGDEQDGDGEAPAQPAHEEQVEQSLQDRDDDPEDEEGEEHLSERGDRSVDVHDDGLLPVG